MMNRIIALIFSSLTLILFSHSLYAQSAVETNPVDNQNTPNNNKQNINLFSLSYLDNKALISLSDIYPLSDDLNPLNNESVFLAIPNRTKQGYENKQYQLEGKYRAKFLSQTGIAETDFVFIYDYQHNQLVSFAVKDLKVIALLNIYANKNIGRFSQVDYMIGFEIDKKALKTFKDQYPFNLIYIGAKNPFAMQPLTPLVWHKINTNTLPPLNNVPEQITSTNVTSSHRLIAGNTYLSEANGWHYFLQDFLANNDQTTEVVVRNLIIIDPQTQNILFEREFRNSEGRSLSQLKGIDTDDALQWSGTLLNNRPPVVFGFEWLSFSCPYLQFITPVDEYISNKHIVINCDNRH